GRAGGTRIVVMTEPTFVIVDHLAARGAALARGVVSIDLDGALEFVRGRDGGRLRRRRLSLCAHDCKVCSVPDCCDHDDGRNAPRATDLHWIPPNDAGSLSDFYK